MFSFYATCHEEIQSVIKEVGGLIYILRETIPSVPLLRIRVELIRRGHWSLSRLPQGKRQGAPWTGHCSYTGMTHRDTQPCTLTPVGN